MKYEDYYNCLMNDTLPDDFQGWHMRSLKCEIGEHSGRTLLHMAALMGKKLPAGMDNWDDPRWQWAADDGYTVKDAWKEYCRNLVNTNAAVNG
jgi:hypothetical protein